MDEGSLSMRNIQEGSRCRRGKELTQGGVEKTGSPPRPIPLPLEGANLNGVRKGKSIWNVTSRGRRGERDSGGKERS